MWILIYFLAFANSATTSQSVTFTSQEQCESAAHSLEAMAQDKMNGSDWMGRIHTVWTCTHV